MHHKKEVSRTHLHGLSEHQSAVLTNPRVQAARVLALQAAYRKAEMNQGRESKPTVGQIRNLGLLNKEEDTKKVLGASS